MQAHLRPGGVAVVNVLTKGTTYLDMFDPSSHCLFSREEMHTRFAGWEILHFEQQDFPAPRDQVKSFVTVVARKPALADVASPVATAAVLRPAAWHAAELKR